MKIFFLNGNFGKFKEMVNIIIGNIIANFEGAPDETIKGKTTAEINKDNNAYSLYIINLKIEYKIRRIRMGIE